MRYRVQRGLVTARSDAGTVKLSRVSGEIDFDADRAAAARAQIGVDMRSFATGSEFSDWEFGKLDPTAHPTAELVIVRVESLRETTAGGWTGAAEAQLRWRDRRATVRLRGNATVDRRNIDLTASFDVDGAALGAPPGKIAVQVTLFGVVVAEGRGEGKGDGALDK